MDLTNICFQKLSFGLKYCTSCVAGINAVYLPKTLAIGKKERLRSLPLSNLIELDTMVTLVAEGLVRDFEDLGSYPIASTLQQIGDSRLSRNGGATKKVLT